MQRKITRVVITTTAGREITVEGPGTANLVTRKTDGVPSALLTISMPVEAHLEKGGADDRGEIGTFVATSVTL